jgi:uncharacterized membrane protein YeaQ/YmgE (transglycosylase-associated protein family)
MTLGVLGVLGWVFFGLIIGLMARALLPGRDPMGFVATAVLGVLGALFGGWVGQALGFYGPGSRAGFIGAVVGAMVLLYGYRWFALRQARAGVNRAVRRGSPRALGRRRSPAEREREREKKSA